MTITAPIPLEFRRTWPATPAPVLDLVIPVYNEEADLEGCVRRLHEQLTETFPYSFRLTIADNASTDDTLAIALRLARELPDVDVLHLREKGRGRALRTAWLRSDAAVLAYTDVDLSTDLNALLPLVAPLMSGHSHLTIGSRLARGSRVVRGPKREVISRSYNLLLRGTLAARFTDAQCGFKAIRSDVAQLLLPLVEDQGWFFDTELLVLAQRTGLRIHEVPVDWVDDPDSRVDIVATAMADLRGIARLGRALATRSLPLADVRAALTTPAAVNAESMGSPGRSLLPQAARFAAVGALSTMAYVVLFLLLAPMLGAQAANASALVTTAVANTAANRRLTFGIRGRARWLRHHAQGLLAFAAGLALTSSALALVHLAGATSRVVEVGVLIAANLAATLLRFVSMRAWIFRQALA